MGLKVNLQFTVPDVLRRSHVLLQTHSRPLVTSSARGLLSSSHCLPMAHTGARRNESECTTCTRKLLGAEGRLTSVLKPNPDPLQEQSAPTTTPSSLQPWLSSFLMLYHDMLWHDMLRTLKVSSHTQYRTKLFLLNKFYTTLWNHISNCTYSKI